MTRLLRVLIVEDSDDDAAMLLEELHRGGFEVVHVRVQTAEAMRAALVEQPWDVIMSDYSMPTFTGIGALSVLKETGIDIPLIIASGTIGEETAVEALKAGASDFLVKDRLARLIPAIERETREAEGRRARRAAEMSLSETKKRMQFALEAAGVGVWESDIASGRTSWSDILEQLHGLPVGAFAGTFDAFIECIHADDRQRVLNSISESLRNRLDSRLEYRTKWPDGSTHWIAGIGRTFYSEAGEPIRAAGVGIDITSQKNLEEQFRQAQKLEAIGSLAAGVAHDFNNVLTAILGYCDLLLDDAGNDAHRADLEEIKKAGIHAASLTSRLLAFSRKQIVEPKILDLNAVVTDTGHMLQRMVGEDVEIEFHLASGLDLVKADPGQMNQVLMNLVVNARDALPQGGKLTVETANVQLDESDASTHLSVLPGPHVMLAVADNGMGMTAEVQARLFEPFFTTKEPGKGTGLGLASIYGIVKQSGGNIWVYSEPGHGTTFKIFLPRAAESEAAAGPADASVATLDGTETILVVEDSSGLRVLVSKILHRYGYSVLSAGTAEDALRLWHEHGGSIQLLLTDVVMPGTSGPSLASQLTSQHPAMRVLYMSGYTDDAIVRHGLLQGGAAFLQKPFAPDRLARKVRQVLDAADSKTV